MSSITIRKVEHNSDLKRFIDFPHDLYASDSNYVPELYMAQETLLNRKKNPYFQHAEADYFLATDAQGKIVGRIMATVNDAYVEFSGHHAGFFGFYDCIEDKAVSDALLDTAIKWLKERGYQEMLGPCNFSTNDTCGTLVENFSVPPQLLTTYNFPYYADLLESYGLKKYTDLLSYELTSENFTDRIKDVAAKLEQRLADRGVTLRTIDLKRFDEEIARFLEIYNASWDKNLGFVPMTPEEVKHMGKDLKSIIDPDFVLFAEKDGKTIGMALSLPNFNEVLIKVKRGRLFPTGIFKILANRKKIKSVRIVALGILPEYRRTGLDMCMYIRTYETGFKKGIYRGEASWILEDNLNMNKALLQIGGKMYRKHRIYHMNFSH